MILLASAINAKAHLISGLIIGGLFVAASVQIKRNGRCLINQCNAMPPNGETNVENPIT